MEKRGTMFSLFALFLVSPNTRAEANSPPHAMPISHSPPFSCVKGGYDTHEASLAAFTFCSWKIGDFRIEVKAKNAFMLNYH